MAYEAWMDKRAAFKQMDLRHIQGNFFQGLYQQAAKLPQGAGLEIIQTFEPRPLYESLTGIGYEYHTEELQPGEFHAWFYRAEVKEDPNRAPFRPVSLLNFPMINEELGQVAVDFWDLTWNDSKHTLSYEMRLLLSLTNAVGAGRMRQATRELVKAYIHGLPSAALDDVFELIAWNQGIGYFSSEIGPSPLFAAYKLIKNQEKKGTERSQICEMLKEQFGDKNAAVKVM